MKKVEVKRSMHDSGNEESFEQESDDNDEPTASRVSL